MKKRKGIVLRGISRCWNWVTDSCEGSFTYGWKNETIHEIWVDGVRIKPTDILEYNSGGWMGGNRSFYLGEYKKEASVIRIKETVTATEDGNVIWEEVTVYVFKKICPYAYKRV